MFSFLSALIPESFDALLVTNGFSSNRRLLHALAKRTFCVMAIDGGIESLRSAGIAPEHVVGDLDSASVHSMKWAIKHGAQICHFPSADQPDIAKGLVLCRKLDCKNIVVAGVTGHRLDHILGMLHFTSAARGLDITLITDEIIAFILRGRAQKSIKIPPKYSVSWFGLPKAKGCALSGVCWPFVNRTLALDGFHSLSNTPVAPAVRLVQCAGRSLFTVSLQPQVVIRQFSAQSVSRGKSQRK